ncbi:hypothetical protein SAMN05444000_10990 [Shimia gijangensis]|uniref:Lipid-binding SYLF domain-containing protein n=1 Tax=Shimia gijangensis TaxID=1470563 RepID=A0A1M6JQD0_9RHOB|nr:hypothetical protein [Shimia gijangensis]SHJ48919.1 hypothetical protein SAMN05444000_10990 [Shimia gijangensis]
MKRLTLTLVLCAALPCAAVAEGLWSKVKKGASDTGQAIGNTAGDVGDAVGDAASKTGDAISGAAKAVDDAVSSTAEMVTDEETPEMTRQRIDGVATESLELLFTSNPEARALYEVSFGYAVFDARQVTLIGATAGYGRGVAVVKETDARTYMSMGTGGVGLSLGIGGFDRKIVVLFEHEDLFRQFVDNGYDATAETGAMFGDDKESQAVRFVNGRSIFVLTKKGWKVSASAAGTKYWKDADLN